ncbi:MAG: formamidopyrimidine-DNA glycolase [Actinobacteria bacterium]|nr:formamidopyrimidine-DNA glycolase [Actinomycetota bacterium]MCA1721295.1 formamidopyrimidine-DNA glycolase [Actinomycetota bacterium]
MPEGHLLHRAAREQSHDLAGQQLRVTSPQGKLDPAAVDGARLREVRAYGKHLLYLFDAAPTVHVHLGMRGLFLRYENLAEPPRKGTRMRLAGTVAYDLIAPTTCELLDQPEVAALLSRLGPDPLDEHADEQEAVRRLRAARGPVAAAVVDQAVWAGIGNAWRAELLYLERVDPRTAAAQVDALSLWRRTRELMARGRDAGQVVSDPEYPDERWVYKRDTCRGCGAPVRTEQIGGRTSYACPVEQS